MFNSTVTALYLPPCEESRMLIRLVRFGVSQQSKSFRVEKYLYIRDKIVILNLHSRKLIEMKNEGFMRGE